MKYVLTWSNLLKDKCPSCAAEWKLDGDFWKCSNHQNGFKIGAAKVRKITADLRDTEEHERQLSFLRSL
jgi:hypothetical protein